MILSLMNDRLTCDGQVIIVQYRQEEMIMSQSPEHRKLERAVEDFILAADEMTLQRLQALTQIRCSQIGSTMFDKERQDTEDERLKAWKGRTW